MIKELIKIANELDNKRLTQEADYIDNLLLKMAIKAYSNGDLVDVKYEGKWYPSTIIGKSHSRKNTYLISYIGYSVKWNSYIEVFGNSNDRIRPKGSQVESSVWESAKRVLYDIPRNQWSKGVVQTLETAGEEASEVISEATQAAISEIIDNPDMVEWVSIGTKLAAGAAIVFPEPATSAGGVAAMKASGFLDVIAAIGYAKAGRNIEAFFSLVAAIAFIPAGPLYRVFKLIKKLRYRGKKMPIDMTKVAPVAFGAGGALILDALIGATQAVTSQATSVVEKYNSSEEGTLYAGTTGTEASISSPVGIVNVNDIASKIIAGAQEVQNELEGWKEIVA